jgi:hypothetical protein
MFVNRSCPGKQISYWFSNSFTSNFSISNKLNFWVRDKKESSAEADYILLWQGKLIPVEVKSGSIGKLKSLHQFIDRAPIILL